VWRVFGGAALVVAGIAAFIEAHSHRSGFEGLTAIRRARLESRGAAPTSGLSPTAYDLLRIGAWALVIFGTLLVVVGLIGYWSGQRRAA
jgi:hypothetical protein